MHIDNHKIYILSLILVLQGCVSVYVPPTTGALTNTEIYTTSLQKRGAMYPDESVDVMIFDELSDSAAGKLKLTVDKNSILTKLETNKPKTLTFYKGIPTMGLLTICSDQIKITPKSDTNLKINFEFHFDYDKKQASECYIDIITLDMNNNIISKDHHYIQ